MSVLPSRRSIREVGFDNVIVHHGKQPAVRWWPPAGGGVEEGASVGLEDGEEVGVWEEEEGTMELVQLGAQRTKNVLILMSDTGGGHRASAEAIRDAFHLEFGDEYKVFVKDVCKEHAGWPINDMERSYKFMVKHVQLWKVAFHSTSPRWVHCFYLAAIAAFYAKKVEAGLKKYKPDIIISVHPLMQHIPLCVLKWQNLQKRVVFVTVITDLNTCHPTWFHANVNRCYCPSEEVAKRAELDGLSPSQIRVFGLPIRPSFCRAIFSKADLRVELELDPHLPAVLLMGGGDGMGPVMKTAKALGESLYDESQRKPIGQLVVICGRNQTLRSTLQLIQWKIPVKIWGFERQMEKWMGACDCIITKAGPGTIAEALIRGLPIILNDFIPGQDLSNPILVNAVKAFSPIRLRLGGTKQDAVIYESGDPVQQHCIPFVKNDSALFGVNEGCLPLSRWDQLNEFFQKTSAQVIFGLNALNGRVLMQDGSLGGPWNHENAKSLIRYTADKGYTIHGWELGNELSGKGIRARVGVAQYAADLISLKKVVDEIYQRNPVKPLVIAPGGNFEAGWYSEFIDMTKGSSSLDVITHHMYILGPGADDRLVEKILNSSFLDRPASVFSCLRDIIRKSGTSATAWVGEAGGAYNSGRHLVTDSFVSSLWYLDQLGMSASYDTKSYCRQSLIGGNYGLLDATTFRPNPDYYSALLWHQLMGPKVLSTNFIGTKNIRAYSQCARPSKGITLVLLNLDPNTTTNVTVKGSNFEQREEYHLTAEAGNLHSQTMLLNGEPLNVNSDGGIPALTPKKVDGSQPIKLAPLSIVFAHFRYFHAPACL